jgi:hypothetical protein
VQLKKFNIVVRCESCHVVARNSDASFDVSVPVVDLESAGQGRATLQCAVSPESHAVSLQAFVDDAGVAMTLPEDVRRRVAQMLQHVAEQRVCGNRRVCPEEVNRLVAAIAEGDDARHD